ncbi:MAG: sulfotransferase [Pleurocapsa sp.]
MNKFPDFIIIGAGKCGTTSIYNYLDQHPQIALCPAKETYFFVPEPVRSKLKPWGAITEIEDYSNLFKGVASDCVVGEISTTYYQYAESAKLISQTLPQTKIIAILRNPATRAFSDYQMHYRKGNEQQDFQEILSPDNRFIKPGFYYAELVPFFEVFDRQQIKIFLFEDLIENPQKMMIELFDFIQVDAKFIPDVSKKSRTGGMPKNQQLNLLLTKDNPLRSVAAAILKIFIPLDLRQKIRSSLIDKNIKTTKLTLESQKILIEIYREDILKLQNIIDRDLSHWLKL